MLIYFNMKFYEFIIFNGKCIEDVIYFVYFGSNSIIDGDLVVVY